jgi:hypothetical protein
MALGFVEADPLEASYEELAEDDSGRWEPCVGRWWDSGCWFPLL